MKKVFYSDKFGAIMASKVYDEINEHCIVLDFFPNIHAKKVFTTYIPYNSQQERGTAFENLTIGYVERVVSSTFNVMRFKN